MKRNASETVLSVVVLLVLIMACVGVLSSIMWCKTERELDRMKKVNGAYSQRIQMLNEELEDKRHKINQANRLLAVAYPNSRMDFLSE